MSSYVKLRASGKKYVGSTRLSEGDYPPGQAYLTERQKKEIVAAYMAGEMTVFEIAFQFQVSDGTVHRLVRKTGVPTRKGARNLPKERLEEAVRMWHDPSVSRQHIASFLGVSFYHVRRFLEGKHFVLKNRRLVMKKPPKSPSMWKEHRAQKAREKLQAWAKARNLGMTWNEISPGRARRAMQHFCAMKKLHPDWFKTDG